MSRASELPQADLDFELEDKAKAIIRELEAARDVATEHYARVVLELDQALARVRELEGLFGRWQNAAARIAAPYHVSVDGEGCPRLHFCQSCQERRTIRDAILAMKTEDVP